MLNRYVLALAMAFGVLFTGQAYAACSAYPYTFTNGTTADATQVNSNFTTVMNCATTPQTLPTRQVLTSGSSATYTTPSNVRQLRIRMVGGGGGGGGSASVVFTNGDGGTGGDTIFNGVHAGGGTGTGTSLTGGGPGGTSSTGTASFRVRGNYGEQAAAAVSSKSTNPAGAGAGSSFGGGTVTGVAAAANTGAGGGGHDLGAYNGYPGGGGGSGEYVELIINSPAATYTYTIGAGGAGGTAGTNGGAGYAGGSGIIIVDELY